MFFSERNTAQMQQLLEEGKEYLSLQKRYWGLQTAEMLTKLLTAIVVWAIIILAGTIVMLFASFALAMWIGKLMNNSIAGFAIMAGVTAILITIVYANRKKWIMAAIARFIVNLTAPPAANETYAQSAELTAAERMRTGTELAERRTQMRQSAQSLFEPTAKAANKWESASNLFHNGMAIFRGVQLGVSAIAAIRMMLGGKKRRRR